MDLVRVITSFKMFRRHTTWSCWQNSKWNHVKSMSILLDSACGERPVPSMWFQALVWELPVSNFREHSNQEMRQFDKFHKFQWLLLKWIHSRSLTNLVCQSLLSPGTPWKAYCGQGARFLRSTPGPFYQQLEPGSKNKLNRGMPGNHNACSSKYSEGFGPVLLMQRWTEG
jgi:hypothetical protein